MNLTTKVVIPKEIHDKIIYWVQKCDYEVSGLGTVSYDKKEKCFVVHDAFLLEQEVGAAHTDLDATAVSKLMYHCHKNKVKGELKFWWHSHVNMSVFWSGTDMDTIKQLGSQGWAVSTVFNKSEESRTAVSMQVNLPMLGEFTHVIDEVSLEIGNYYDTKLTTLWDKELKEKVKKREYSHWNRGTQLGIGNQASYDNKNLAGTYGTYGYWDKDGSYMPYDKRTNIQTSDNKHAGNNYGFSDVEWVGIEAEAKAINMSPYKYAQILTYGSDHDINQLMQALDLAEMDGKLHYSERTTK